MELSNTGHETTLLSTHILTYLSTQKTPSDTSGIALKEWVEAFIDEPVLTQIKAPSHQDITRCGVYVATQNLGAHTSVDFWHQAIQDDINFANPRNFPSTLANSLASQLSIHTGAKGPSVSLMGGQETTAACLQHALTDLQNEIIDHALVIAIDNFFNENPSKQNKGKSLGWLLGQNPSGKSDSLKLVKHSPSFNSPTTIHTDFSVMSATPTPTTYLKAEWPHCFFKTEHTLSE
ncbi:MAG: hypothetical protein JKY01_06480 [Pseudomonadales bacterium]|nr:hypothetical protein [Pseudomonadales bacterium]